MVNNFDFFKSAVINQSEFAEFFREIGRENELSIFSQNLIAALNSSTVKLRPSVNYQTSRGELSQLAAWIHSLSYDDHGCLKQLRRENKQLDKFLTENKFHPCILVWALKEHGLGEKENTDLVFNNPAFKTIIISIIQVGLNFVDYWQELKNNPEVHKLLIDRAQELQASDSRFREAMTALNQIGTLSADDWQFIKENSQLQKSIILLGQVGVNLKDDWRMLKEDLNLQKAIIALSQTKWISKKIGCNLKQMCSFALQCLKEIKDYK
ncbi:hypothetical protein [Piscirickettsia salmonis]|uniref:hypothetical protein n=1 Tax=Piscirickettsia salmonis TaxID=1238 RepID=UPI0007C8AC97|nr:hypothetical protein A0O36_01382 [Piscirickettsiaceae bacterium NZ-RLO1]